MYKQYSKKSAAEPDFWAEHWSKESLEKQMKAAASSELIPIFKKYLPKTGNILEAGCGQGIFVKALSDIGYKIEGIDYDKKTVQQLNILYPELKIYVGDVFKLQQKNNSLSAYISLGVIEHYENDWQKPLTEAHRTLRSGDTIMLSVPYFNLVRRIHLPLRDLFKKPAGEFYQYFFKKQEIVNVILAAGFKIKTIEFYGKAKTLISLPLVGKLFRAKYQKMKIESGSIAPTHLDGSSQKRSLTKIVFDLLPNRWFAHMIMVIAEKK
jgi:2-polyprenyl-3-methyl-5-hydroxy-6-metoxy-1,4-benzoquinol methylase